MKSVLSLSDAYTPVWWCAACILCPAPPELYVFVAMFA
jgi:hypothetical protein